MSRILLSPPDVRERDRARLVAAAESGWAAPAGPDLDAFEQEVARAVGMPYGVALTSGTAALHLSLVGVGVRRGDDVVLASFTFAATANAVTYVGAQPALIDSDPGSWTLSPALLADELAARRQGNSLPAAVVAVDLYGQCADYHEISSMCDELEIPLIEDAAEALGATYRCRNAGSFGAMGVLSFNGNKIITTGGGGMLLTHDEIHAERARYLATQARQPAPHYEHTEVGYNYRLSNLLAAFGRGQLETLDERIERRWEIRRRYQEALLGVPGLGFAPEAPHGRGNAWLTCILLDPDAAPFNREELRLHLESCDIESRPLWKPMHLQPVFARCERRVDGTSERLFETGLCLPSGSGMTDTEQTRVIVAIRDLAGMPS